jgi:putative SOS response-associated peptidase YedK
LLVLERVIWAGEIQTESGMIILCGRFTLTEGIHELQSQFNFSFWEETAPRYNIAPSQNVLAVAAGKDGRRAAELKWGLIPFWAKDPKIGYKMINARSEGIESKPSFRNAFRQRRCLILADGFYEWKKTADGKQPYRFILKGGMPFAFAGLWERWEGQDAPIFSCTIITTGPNSVTEKVHDRMPVILKSSDYDTWLNHSETDLGKLKGLLAPYPSEEMEAYPVSTLVNSPKNELAELISPLNSQ